MEPGFELTDNIEERPTNKQFRNHQFEQNFHQN